MGSFEKIPATNEEFVEYQCTRGRITDDRVKNVFLKVDRANFAPEVPYEDNPVRLGFWSVISSPGLNVSAISTTIDYLVPTEAVPQRRVLDVGSGSGYTTHLLAEAVGPEGIVVAMENVPQLRDMAERNFRKTARGGELLDAGNVVFVCADAREGLTKELRQDIRGLEEQAKFDVIHAAAAADNEVPFPLLNQLKSPGCMFIPIHTWSKTGENSIVWKITKDENGDLSREIIHPRSTYVPLRGPLEDSEEEMNRPGYGMCD